MKKALALFLAALLVFSSLWTGKIVTTKADTPAKGYYTVDEIITVMSGYTSGQISTEEYTVKGVVTESSYNSTHSSYTIWLASDDGNTAKAFELYSAKLDTGITGNFTATDAFAGMTVTCTGYLQKYLDSKTSAIIYEMAYLSAQKSPTGTAVSPLISAVEGESQGGGGETPSELPATATPEEIVNALYALESGAMLSATTKYTLSVVITAINDAWNTQFNNISVTIQVGTMTDKPVLCYRMKASETNADMADVIAGLKVGDTITVNGLLKDYNGKKEFDSNCTLEAYTDGGVATQDLPETATEEEIMTALAALAQGAMLSATNKYTLSGVITKVDTAYNETYNNITVTIQVGNHTEMPIQCYHLTADAANADMTAALPTLKVGDTITVNGKMKDYQGTKEFDANCTLEAYTAAPAITPGGGTGTITTEDATAAIDGNVSFKINFATNPGLITFKMKVEFPEDLELLSVTDGTALTGYVEPSPTLTSPYTLFWLNATVPADITTTGLLATLNFKVKSTATTGDKNIVVTPIESFNYDGDTNTFTPVTGKITVVSCIHTAGDWEISVAPTCTETGTEVKKCTNCGAELDSRTVNALGHDLVHHDAQAATCTAAGWAAYDTCSRCDYTTKVEIPATGHNYSTEWSYDETGHWHACTNEGCAEKQDFEAHTLDGDNCTVCDYKTFMIGDADGDGEVTDWDSVLLNRYLVGWDVDIDLRGLDVDGDGDVTDWDGVLMERYLVGWPVQLGGQS